MKRKLKEKKIIKQKQEKFIDSARADSISVAIRVAMKGYMNTYFFIFDFPYFWNLLIVFVFVRFYNYSSVQSCAALQSALNY